MYRLMQISTGVVMGQTLWLAGILLANRPGPGAWYVFFAVSMAMGLLLIYAGFTIDELDDLVKVEGSPTNSYVDWGANPGKPENTRRPKPELPGPGKRES